MWLINAEIIPSIFPFHKTIDLNTLKLCALQRHIII